MKIGLIVAGILLAYGVTCPVRAQENISTITPEQARQTWDALSPAQQEAAKQIAKHQAQEKAAAFQQLTPEQRQQKRGDAAVRFQARRNAR